MVRGLCAVIRAVFFDLISPSDYNTRLRLADELLKKYGRILFPDEELLPHTLVGMNLDEFITSLIRHLQELRREWQY